MDLLLELKELTKKLNAVNVEYALCGGLAMAIYALPRATLDIDILIEESSLEIVRRAVRELGFSIDAAPMEFQNGKIRIHRVSKSETDTGEMLSLDLLMVTPEIAGVWENRRIVHWEAGKLCVVSPAGLIFLKSLRKSGQDQDDIELLKGITDED